VAFAVPNRILIVAVPADRDTCVVAGPITAACADVIFTGANAPQLGAFTRLAMVIAVVAVVPPLGTERVKVFPPGLAADAV